MACLRRLHWKVGSPDGAASKLGWGRYYRMARGINFSRLAYDGVHRIARFADRFAPATIAMPFIAWSDAWGEEPEMRILRWLIGKDEVAIDIGAANGSYSYYMARLGGECHAFEPNPTSAALLQRRVPRVCVHGIALSSRKAEATLRVPKVDGFTCRGWGTVHATNDFSVLPPHEVETVQVETATLDSFGFSRVGLIKIDVEGHELEVLRGALSTIEKERPSLLVEAEDRHRPNAFASVRELLAPFGYTAWYLREGRLSRADDMSRSKDMPRNFLFLYRGNPARHSQIANLFLK